MQSAEPDTSTYDAYQTLSREMCTSYLNTSTPTCTAILAKVGAEGHKRGGEQVRLRLFCSAMCKFFAEQGLSIRNIDAYVTKVSSPDADIVDGCVLHGPYWTVQVGHPWPLCLFMMAHFAWQVQLSHASRYSCIQEA